MERLVGGMLGASGPGSSSAESPAASPDEFFAFLQQYVAMGGSLEPDAAPPELAPVLRALAEGSGGVGALREMLLAGDAADLAGASSAGSGGPPAGSGGRPGSRAPPAAPAPPPSDREEIFPSPGFVVKTSDDAGRKVFINVCAHAKIQAPGSEWAGGKIPEHVEKALANLEDPEAVQQLRFPLSVGDARNELDKSGHPCTTYDAVFNDDVVAQAMAHRGLKNFLTELTLQWIAQKYALNLDPKVKLPHRRYVGPDRPHPQWIRVEKKSMIEEINEPDEEPTFALRPRPLPTRKKKTGTGSPGPGLSRPGGEKEKILRVGEKSSDDATRRARTQGSAENENENENANGASSYAAKKHSSSQFDFAPAPEPSFSVSFVGRPVTSVRVRFEVPSSADVERVKIGAVTEGVVLDVPGCRPNHRVALPFAIDADRATATLEVEEEEEGRSERSEGGDEGGEGGLRIREPANPEKKKIKTAAIVFEAPYVAYDALVEKHTRAGAHAVGEVKGLSAGFLDV
jgi:hypothetical protein